MILFSEERLCEIRDILKGLEALNPEADATVDMIRNLCNLLVGFLSSEDSVAQQALWCFTNIALLGPQASKCVLFSGCISRVVALSASNDDAISTQAFWVLANVSVHYGHHLVVYNVVPVAVSALSRPGLNLERLVNCLWMVSGVCSSEEPIPKDQAEPLIRTLSDVLLQQDDNVLTLCCNALSLLSEWYPEMIPNALRVWELCGSGNPTVKQHCIRICVNVAKHGAFPESPNLVQLMCTLLCHNALVKDMCWGIGVMCKAGSGLALLCLQSGAFEHLLGITTTECDAETADYVIYAIFSVVNGFETPSEIYRTYPGVLRVLSAGACMTSSSTIIGCLRSISILLGAGASEHFQNIQGVELISRLASHSDQDISLLASDIQYTYFNPRRICYNG